MAELELPTGPAGITADWLTRALRATGTIRDAAVTAFDLEPDIAAGVGFMGQLARITPTYDRSEDGAPASIIAKLPTPTTENREIADAFRFYEIETRFYEEIAGQAEIRTPSCYYSRYEPETRDFVLLLEDLAPAQMGDQVAGCTVEQARLALRELAKFHATWWENPRVGDFDWLPPTNETFRAQAAQDNYQQAWVAFVENFSDGVPPEIMEIGERFGSKVIQLMDALAQPPRTIMHGDYRLDNMFFATAEGGATFTMVDWQIISHGRGAFDVAYFLCGSLPPEDRKANEMELLHMYHDVLTERGVTGYDFDQFFQDYRASMLFCWLYTVIVLGALDMATERGVALFTAILQRNSAAIVDLNAGEFLPE